MFDHGQNERKKLLQCSTVSGNGKFISAVSTGCLFGVAAAIYVQAILPGHVKSSGSLRVIGLRSGCDHSWMA